IGGNFPSEAIYMLEEQKIYPYKNYTLAEEKNDATFPLTRIVGKAGEGKGKPIALRREFVAINGAGFGKINSNLILKRFQIDDLDLSAQEKETYRQKCAKRLEEARILAQKIRRGETPLVKQISSEDELGP